MISYIFVSEHPSHGETAQNQCSADSLSEVAHKVCNDVLNYLLADCGNPPVGYYATRRVSRKSADADAQLSFYTPQHYVEMLTHIANEGGGFTKAYLEDEIPRHHRKKADYDFPNGSMGNNDLFFNLTLAEQARKLNEARQRNKVLMGDLSVQECLNWQLRKKYYIAKEATAEGVRIETIREMFQSEEYDRAKELFKQLDYYLHKDPTWIKYKDEFRSIIEEKKNSNRVSQYVIVHGDYVVNKHVANEVNGVGKNGVGINLIKE